MAPVADAVAALSFVGLAVVLPGVAVLRLLRVLPEAALVLPAGLVACAATALLAVGTGRPTLFPILLLVVDLSARRRRPPPAPAGGRGRRGDAARVRGGRAGRRSPRPPPRHPLGEQPRPALG